MGIDRFDLLMKSQEVRRELGEDETSPTDIFALVTAIEKLTIVRYPMSDNLSGMCIKAQDNCVIAINSRMSLGRQRFSLAHELYHLYYDESMTAICSADIGSGSELERSADIFAAYFLIPPAALKSKIRALKAEGVSSIGLNEAIQLEQYFGVSHQAMLSQLMGEKEITAEQAGNMKNGVTRAAEELGFSTELYRRFPPEKQYQTNGYLIKQTVDALEKDLISEGKYEEILLQAFRSDLVFGDDDEGGEAFD